MTAIHLVAAAEPPRARTEEPTCVCVCAFSRETQDQLPRQAPDNSITKRRKHTNICQDRLSGQKQKHKKDSRSSGESALKARCFAAPYVPSENSELTWLTPETDGTCSFNSCNLRFCDFAIWFLRFGLVLLCECLGSVIAFQSILWLSFRLSV